MGSFTPNSFIHVILGNNHHWFIPARLLRFYLLDFPWLSEVLYASYLFNFGLYVDLLVFNSNFVFLFFVFGFLWLLLSVDPDILN